MIFNYIAAIIGLLMWVWLFYQVIEALAELKEWYNERKNR